MDTESPGMQSNSPAKPRFSLTIHQLFQSQSHPANLARKQSNWRTLPSHKTCGNPLLTSSIQKRKIFCRKYTLLSKKKTDQANHPQTAVIINDVIQVTEEWYKKYRQGGLKIPKSTGEDIDLRKQSQKIINAALSFQEIISTAANFDPTHHAANAWAVISLGLTVSHCGRFIDWRN